MNVLVVALDAVTPADVRDAEVLVVAPALNSWLRRWLSDEDAARRRAEGRAAAVVERLEFRGVHAEGRVGDADPLLAIADALPTFHADEIVIAAEPEHSQPAHRRARLAGTEPLRAPDLHTGQRPARQRPAEQREKGRSMNIHRNTNARRLRPAVLAGAVAAAALGAALAAPGGAGAALGYAHHHRRSLVPPPGGHPQPPTIENGVLSITGTRGDDRIALRLQTGAPNLLQVDFGNDGSPEFTVDRTGVTSIDVDAGGGSDSVSIDESNGQFENVPTTIDGGSGDDRIAGGSGNETLIGGGGDDTIDGNRGADTAFMGGGDDTFIWDPGDGSDVLEGQGGHDRMLFNGAPAPSRSTSPRTATACASSATRPTSRWTRTASSGSTSSPSAAPTSSP